MPEERFIQDAFSHPDRILRVLRDENIGRDWTFCLDVPGKPDDVVNQEFSFVVDDEGGRADVIATFNNRQKLMICEVKSGAVGDGEIEQLRWYVDGWNAHNVKVGDPSIGSVQDVIGVLLAEDFLPIKQEHLDRSNIYFVRFRFNGNEFPFEVVNPTSESDDVDSSVATKKQHKQSWLCEMKEKTVSFDEIVRLRFEEWLRFLLPEDDPRRMWVYANIKGGHVWMTYKSERLLCLFPRTKAFHGHFSHGGFSGEFTETDEVEKFKRDVFGMLDVVDNEYHSEIPKDFCWELCK